LLIPINKAAELSGISHSTIRRRIEAGELEAFTERGRQVVRLSDVQNLYPDTKPTTVGACRVFALANQKGGVGKTSTCANLAAALAQRGHEVLVIDCDPQCNLTQSLGVNPDALKATLYSVLVEGRSMEDAIIGSPPAVQNLPNLKLVGADLELADADMRLAGAVGRETLLQEALEPVRSRFEFVLLDCPPALGVLTINALAAATEVIIPVDMGIFSLKGVARLQETIQSVRRKINPDLKRVRALRSKMDSTNMSGEVAAELERAFGPDLLQTKIRTSVRVREAQAAAKPITIWSPDERVSQDYIALAKEICDGP
jgi:chromosome partitioning protein